MNRVLLIARREFAAYARTVGFWLSLLAFPLIIVLAGGLGFLTATSQPARAIAIVEEGAEAEGLAAVVRDVLGRDNERRAANLERAGKAASDSGIPVRQNPIMASVGRERIRIVQTPPAILQAAPGGDRDEAVRQALSDGSRGEGRLDAVVFLNRGSTGPAARLWTARATDPTVEEFVRTALTTANRQAMFSAAGIDPAVVVQTEQFRPQIDAFSPKAADGGAVTMRDRLPVFIGLGGGFLLWSLIITGASILLNSVMEEKSNKILEVLLSSASATEILAGKVLGVAMLTLTVLLAWGGMGAAGLVFGAPEEAMAVGDVLLAGGMLAWFAAFMVGGYLMYAVLFAAIGAFCETPRDAQTLMGPIMMVLVIPIIVMQMAVRSPDAPVVQILSLVPFFTPFLMMARLPSDPPMIELVGSMLGMFAFALLMVWVSGRAFRAGALSDVKLNWKSFAGAIRGGGK